MHKRGLKYFVVDVFANEQFYGNPLAVIEIPKELALTEYKDIAKEFGYSETSFVHYSKSTNTLRVRSFTPTGFEINGAGHNLLGAVHAVLKNDIYFKLSPAEIPKIIMKDKTIPIGIDRYKVGILQQPASLLKKIPSEKISEAISISKEDIYNIMEPTVVKTEVAHLMVPLTNSEVLNRANPKKALLQELAEQYGFQGVYCFALSENNSDFISKTRFFNPGIGIVEDPATGSAAGPLIGFLSHHHLVQRNKTYKIIQGEKMGRPSILSVCIEPDGILLSGTAIISMEGTIFI